MLEITELRETSGGEVLVELDGQAWRSFPTIVVVRAELRVGKRLGREDLRLLRRELKRALALDTATRALAQRPLSRAMLEARLERKGVTQESREEAVEALEKARCIDDPAYALVRAQGLAARGWGNQAIAFKLEQDGIASEQAERALGALESERERAGALARVEPDRGRLLGRLARRGFDAETIEEIAGDDLTRD